MLLLCLSLLPFTAQAENLRLLTFNTYMLPSPLKHSKQKERARLIPERIRAQKIDADIMVFQEAFSGNFKKQMKQELGKDYPYHETLGRHGGLTKFLDGGLLVMSRYPIKLLGKTYFKQCAKADCFASKGALLVEMTKPDGSKVQIVTSHLQSGQSKPKYRKIRESQVLQIKELMDRHARPGIPQILAGDLNINKWNGDEYSQMLTTLGAESSELSGRLTSSISPNTKCFTKTNRTSTKLVDHVVMNPRGSLSQVTSKEIRPITSSFRGVEDCDLSDHLPVVGNLKISNEVVKPTPAPVSAPVFDEECVQQVLDPEFTNLLQLMKDET